MNNNIERFLVYTRSAFFSEVKNIGRKIVKFMCYT